MVDSVNIPTNLTKIIEITYKDDQLRKFLIDMLLRVDVLEKKVRVLETKVEALTNGN